MHSWFDVLYDSSSDANYLTIDEKTQFLNRAQLKFAGEVASASYFNTGDKPEENISPFVSELALQAGEDVLRPITTELKSHNTFIKSLYQNNAAGDAQYTPTVNKYGQFSHGQLNRYARGMLKDRHDDHSNAYTWEEVDVLSILSVSWYTWSDTSLKYVRRADVDKSMNDPFNFPKNLTSPVYFNQGNGIYEVLPRSLPNNETFYNVYGFEHTTANTFDYSNYDVTSAFIPPDINKVRLNVTVIRSPLPMKFNPITGGNVSCELPDYTHDAILQIAIHDAKNRINRNQPTGSSNVPAQQSG